MTASRLIEIWNSLPGVSPVRKFTSCRVALDRICNGIQNLAPEKGTHAVCCDEAGQPTKGTTPSSAAPVGGKTAITLGLLKRREGATLKQLMEGTEWQAHTVPGFLSGTLRKKMGLMIESVKSAAGGSADLRLRRERN